jgi:MoxR-like ATPase
MRFSLGYPSMDDELKMLEMLHRSHPIDDVQPVVTADDLVAAQKAVREVHVDDKIRRYITQIVQDTRDCDELSLGASPRASIALFRCSQALSAISGRNYVQPDDVKRVSAPVLTHRLILRPESRLRKVTAASVVEDVVEEVPVPMMVPREVKMP